MSFTPLVKLWLWISAFATAAGWILSALGQLNHLGYTILFAAFVVFTFLFRKELGFNLGSRTSRWKKLRRRFRRPLPICFALLALLIFIGGAWYPPTQYTGLNYRMERVLQWLAHEQWWWVHTPNSRVNTRACGIEWMTAPLLLFTRSDRALFLLNFIPFLLLPGLIFSVFTRLGFRARVAWQWMWLLPTGYTFVLQAGSIGNDTFPAVYTLAAIDFAARAWGSRRPPDLWHSILAAALMVGAKSSNLPLGLPWALLVFPLIPLLWRKKIATGLVFLLAVLVSFLPTAILNTHYCGEWTAANIEPPCCVMKNPVAGLYGNAVQLLLNNFVPPVFPLAGWWNAHAESFMPVYLVSAAHKYFDEFGLFRLPELATEDYAGIGPGLCVLLVISVLASFWKRGFKPAGLAIRSIPSGLCRCVHIAAWISLSVYCMGTGMVTAARLIAPYYALLLPLLLLSPVQSEIIRRWWWRALVGVALCVSFVVLILSPDRPMWPAQTLLTKALARHPENRSLARALNVYTVYSKRSDSLACIRDLLPPGTKVVGFIGGGDDVDVSLWRPYGERRVEIFLVDDPPELVRQHVQYAVLDGWAMGVNNLTIDAWLQKSGADLIATTNVTLMVAKGPQSWYVVRFRP